MGRKIFSTSSVTTTQNLWSTWKESKKPLQPWSEHWHWFRVPWMLVRASPGKQPGRIPWESAHAQQQCKNLSVWQYQRQEPFHHVTNPLHELLADTSPEKDPFTIKNEFAKSTQDDSPSTGEWLLIITEIFSDYQFQRLKVLKKISVRLTSAHQTTESRNQGYLLGFAPALFPSVCKPQYKNPQIPAVAQYTTHKCIISPMSQSPPEQLLFPHVSHSSWELAWGSGSVSMSQFLISWKRNSTCFS